MKLHFRVIIFVAGALLLAANLFAQSNAQNNAHAQPPTENNDKPLAFHTAIELALKNSATTGLAQADLQRARSVVSQTKNAFLPQMVVGSGLGASYGFPLSLEGAAP